MNLDDFQNTSLVQLCDWCEKPVIQSSLAIKLICRVCYQTLTNAGISEKEIYEKTRRLQKA